MAIQVGVFYSFLEQHLSQHPDWIVLEHEELCRDPVAGFRELFSVLDLEWSPRVEQAIHLTNATGEGFQTRRISAEEPEKWAKILTPAQADEIKAALRPFGLTRWPQLAAARPYQSS
jgi:hypothetical protein